MPTVLSDPESLTQSSVPSSLFGPDVCMDTMPPRLFFGIRALPRIVVCFGGWYGQDGTWLLFGMRALPRKLLVSVLSRAALQDRKAYKKRFLPLPLPNHHPPQPARLSHPLSLALSLPRTAPLPSHPFRNHGGRVSLGPRTEYHYLGLDICSSIFMSSASVWPQRELWSIIPGLHTQAHARIFSKT